MKNFRYGYLIGGICFLGFAIIFLVVVVDWNVIINFPKNGVTEKSPDKSGQALMLFFDLAQFWLLLMILIITGLGIYLVIKFLHESIDNIRNHRIRHFGRNGTGTYLKHEEIGKMRDIAYYEIYFSFENDSGTIVETKNCGGVFSPGEAAILAAMKTFPVKYIGDNAVIIADKESALLEAYKQSERERRAFNRTETKEGIESFKAFFKLLWYASVVIIFLYSIFFEGPRIYDYIMGNYDIQEMKTESFECFSGESSYYVSVYGHIDKEKVYFQKKDADVSELYKRYPQLLSTEDNLSYKIKVLKFEHSSRVMLTDDDDEFFRWKKHLLLSFLYITISIIVILIIKKNKK